MTTFGPPMSDSDSDYDGYYFDDVSPNNKTKNTYHWVKSGEQELINAISQGDLQELKKQMILQNFDVNSTTKGGTSLILLACTEGNYDIVRYLIEDLKADCSSEYDSITPVLAACGCQKPKSDEILKIVKLLKQHGNNLEDADKFGTTPLIRACENGHISVVQYLVEHVDLEWEDNFGNSALFHAIEKNQREIVQILVDAGVDTKKPSGKGFTAAKLAEYNCFENLLQIIPQTATYDLPTGFLSYNTLYDYIPRIFPKTECPEYFQEINSILFQEDATFLLPYLAKANVSLFDFLRADDNVWKELGIEFPFHRSTLLMTALNYHMQYWTTSKIPTLSLDRPSQTFYDLLILEAIYLRHLTVIHATFHFVKNHMAAGQLGNIKLEKVKSFQKGLKTYRKNLKQFSKTLKYLVSLSPEKSPLFIDWDEICAKRRRENWWRSFRNAVLAIGISYYVGVKIKNWFF